MKKLPAVILGAGLMLGVAAGCGSSSNDGNSSELRDEMMENGASEEAADCVIQGFEDEGLPLTADAEVLDEQTKKAGEIVMDCIKAEMPDLSIPDITLPDVTIPDITIPDITIPDITIPDITIPDITIPDITIP